MVLVPTAVGALAATAVGALVPTAVGALAAAEATTKSTLKAQVAVAAVPRPGRSIARPVGAIMVLAPSLIAQADIPA